MEHNNLPEDVKTVTDTYVSGILDILAPKLYGVYQYGAIMFEDSGPVIDIDCHTVLNEPLTDSERKAITLLNEDIAERFPKLGSELDIWYVLTEDARKATPPVHQLDTNRRDEWWALHCAHIRAGRYRTLYGPEPDDIFPEPSWEAISAALDYEIADIKTHTGIPAYDVLNLCRVMYSFENRDVVLSKRFGALWIIEQHPEWKPLIEAALNDYAGTATEEEELRLKADRDRFVSFALERIDNTRQSL